MKRKVLILTLCSIFMLSLFSSCREEESSEVEDLYAIEKDEIKEQDT